MMIFLFEKIKAWIIYYTINIRLSWKLCCYIGLFKKDSFGPYKVIKEKKMTVEQLFKFQSPKVKYLRGKVETQMESLKRKGQFKPIIVLKDPRYKKNVYRIFDGSNRLEAARRLNWKTLKVRIIGLNKLK